MCLLSSVIHQFGKHGPLSIQDVAPKIAKLTLAPKIAKLTYKWLNTMVYGR